jgi:hypothetical protein
LVIATPQSEDELARLQRHNKRLEELIEIYEKQFSVDALAALAYPSLAFAHVPLPHAKVLFFCASPRPLPYRDFHPAWLHVVPAA